MTTEMQEWDRLSQEMDDPNLTTDREVQIVERMEAIEQANLSDDRVQQVR